jgi:hypothetical protein
VNGHQRRATRLFWIGGGIGSCGLAAQVRLAGILPCRYLGMGCLSGERQQESSGETEKQKFHKNVQFLPFYAETDGTVVI